MSSRRTLHGFSLALAAVGLGVLAVFVFAFAVYSRNELGLVRRALEHKRAEYLASSGIEWARASLQKRRWYVAANRYWGVHEEVDPWGPGSGTMTVVCEDMRHPEIRHYTFREAAMLSHVNVYSRGRAGERSVLLYGRFIMSPLPWLRSDSTDGAPETDEASSLGEFTAGELPVDVPKYAFEGGTLDAQILAVLVSEGQTVALNQPLARIQLLGLDAPTELIARAPGRVARILARTGDKVPGGTTVMVLTPDEGSGTSTVPFTLKAMVRITRITDPGLVDLDIDSPAAREAIRAFVAAKSPGFLANHARWNGAAESLDGGAAPRLPPKVTSAELLALVPPAGGTPPTGTPGENTFIRDRFLGFAWPCTPPDQLTAARAAINFVLDLQPPKSNPLVQKLFAASGTPYKTASPVKEVPGADAAARLLDVTRIGLDDAGFVDKAGTFVSAQWSHSCRWTGKFATGDGGFDPATLGQGVMVDGVFYRGLSCTQRPYDRPYYLYTEPGGRGKKIKVAHVLNFFRMMVTEAGAIAPTQPIRLDIDLIDRVVYPPPGPTPMGGGVGDLN